MHRFGCQELTFLDIDHLAGVGRGDQKVGLTAQKRRNLQYVHIFGGYGGFGGQVYVSDYGYAEGIAHFGEYAQCLFVSYALKRVQSAAVGLAVAALEYVRYAQLGGGAQYVFGNVESHFFALNDARTGQKEEC